MSKATEIDIANIATKIVSLLTPLTSEQRQRAVQAALTLVGDTPLAFKSSTDGSGVSDENVASVDNANITPRVRNWMRQNSLTMDLLQEVFHLHDGVGEVIAAEVPGKNAKEKTLNAYVLQGVCAFVTSGNAVFDDKSARSVAKTLGCLNLGNHVTYLNDRGNLFTGSKEKGWTLTAPGLTHGSSLIKGITKSDK